MIKSTISEMKDKMNKSKEVLKEELTSIRAGRANPMLLDKVTATYYGVETPLKQLANISAPEPRMLQINPYDISAIHDIEKGIQKANLGVNPSNDGKVIRIMMPMLTEERRVELTKQAKHTGEEAKISVRNIRRDVIDKLKKANKASEITEDDLTRAEKEVQDITDSIVKDIDAMIAKKSEEILEV